MKKSVLHYVVCLLGLSVCLLVSCKKDEERRGSPTPLLGMSVKMASADSMVQTRITLNQQKKLVTLSMDRAATDLKHVTCKFDLVQGASLYTPFTTNPVIMDLSDSTKSGVNINTGNQIVGYRIIAEVDQPLIKVTAKAGETKAGVTLDEEAKSIFIYFGDAVVDRTKVDISFEISPITTMIEPASSHATMDLSKDTVEVKVSNKFMGEMIYNMICWSDPSDSLRTLTGIGCNVTPLSGETKGYHVETTDNGAFLVTDRFPVSFGTVLTFEYRSADSIGRPLLALDRQKKSIQMKGWPMDIASDWTTYTVDMGGIIDDGGGLGYSLSIGLMNTKATSLDIRNVKMRPRTMEEEERFGTAYILTFTSGSPANTMKFNDLTKNPAFKTYEFIPTDVADPNKNIEPHPQKIDANIDNQVYFEYKAECQFVWSFFWQIIDDTWESSIGQTFQPSEVWVPVHVDWTDEMARMWAVHPDAGDAGRQMRFDFVKNTVSPVNVPIVIRNLRLEKKR